MLRLSVAYTHPLTDQRADRTQAFSYVKIVCSLSHVLAVEDDHQDGALSHAFPPQRILIKVLLSFANSLYVKSKNPV